MKGVMARWSYSDGWKFQNRRVGEGENHVKWATARATAEGEGESCRQIECDDSTTLTCVPTLRLFHPSDACVDIKSEIQTLKYHWRTSPPVAECFCYSRHSKKPNHRYQQTRACAKVGKRMACYQTLGNIKKQIKENDRAERSGVGNKINKRKVNKLGTKRKEKQ